MTKSHLLAGLAALALLSTPAMAQKSPEATAEAALKKAPVFDGHNDVPWALRGRVDNMINNFDFQDTTDTAKPEATPPEIAMHTDLMRLRRAMSVRNSGRSMCRATRTSNWRCSRRSSRST